MNRQLELAQALDALDAAPVGVLVTGVDDKAIWANQAMLDIIGASRDDVMGLERGQVLANLTPAEDAADVFSAGVSPSGEPRWLRLDAHQAAHGAGYILYFSDVTEQRRLALRLAQSETHDPLTGLLNERALLQALESELSRSRRYSNPLSAVMMQVESVAPHADGVQPVQDQVVLAISHFLRDQLRWVDIIGRTGEQGFTVILPETNEADAAKLVEKINKRFASLILPQDDNVKVAVSARFASAGVRKGDDVKRLMARLQASMA